MGSVVYMVVIIGAMWFFLFRPQQQQAKKRAQMLTTLRTGIKVTTIGGIYGIIKAVTDTKVYLEIADGVTIEMLRSAIGQIDESDKVVEEKFEEDDEYEDDDEEDDDIYYDDEYEDDDEVNKEKVNLTKK